MATSLSESLDLAWKSLWDDSTPYHFASAVRKGIRSGAKARVRPVKSLSFPDTGDVVLFNRDPWGGVSINLKNNKVCQLHTGMPQGVEFDPATFEPFGPESVFQKPPNTRESSCVVRRGLVTGSALKMAGLALKSIDRRCAPGADQYVTQAQAYQSQLVNTDNGRLMVGTYYDHNEAYCQIFTNTLFLKQWQTHQTEGQNTAQFAAQTYNASLSGSINTVSVNGQPNSQGNSPYNLHAFYMQLLVVATCNAQCNCKAALAASNFQGVTQPQSLTAQTVSNVINIVNTSTPPAPPSPPQDCTPSPGVNCNSSSTSTSTPALAEPAWMEELRALAAPVIVEIQKEEDDVRRGIKLRETTGLPIPGYFRDYVSTPELTLTGKVHQAENGDPVVEFTGASGSAPEVNVKLGAFPGTLFPDVEAALARSNFLKSVLGARIVSTIGSPEFLRFTSRLMTMAASQRLGTVRR